MSAAVKERPILFSAPMVRAILDGRKTQTRRVMKPQMELVRAKDGDGIVIYAGWALPVKKGGSLLWPNANESIVALCPYGVPGDRLWVREALRLTVEGPPVYEADGELVSQWVTIPADAAPFVKPYRPGMLMPRWASRITLELTDVRVELLQDISYDDILAEGTRIAVIDKEKAEAMPLRDKQRLARDAFYFLWEGINGERAPWASNPWVWALTFRRVDGR